MTPERVEQMARLLDMARQVTKEDDGPFIVDAPTREAVAALVAETAIQHEAFEKSVLALSGVDVRAELATLLRANVRAESVEKRLKELERSQQAGCTCGVPAGDDLFNEPGQHDQHCMLSLLRDAGKRVEMLEKRAGDLKALASQVEELEKARRGERSGWMRRVAEKQARIDELEAMCIFTGDTAQPEDAEIGAAHPTKTGNHDRFREAMRLVGSRQGKYALVNLVNMLLARIDAETARVNALAAEAATYFLEREEARRERDGHHKDCLRLHEKLDRVEAERAAAITDANHQRQTRVQAEAGRDAEHERAVAELQNAVAFKEQSDALKVAGDALVHTLQQNFPRTVFGCIDAWQRARGAL